MAITPKSEDKYVEKCSIAQSFIFPKWHAFKIGTLGQQLCLGKSNGAGAAERIEQILQLLEQVIIYQLGQKRLNDLNTISDIDYGK